MLLPRVGAWRQRSGDSDVPLLRCGPDAAPPLPPARPSPGHPAAGPARTQRQHRGGEPAGGSQPALGEPPLPRPGHRFRPSHRAPIRPRLPLRLHADAAASAYGLPLPPSVNGCGAPGGGSAPAATVERGRLAAPGAAALPPNRCVAGADPAGRDRWCRSLGTGAGGGRSSARCRRPRLAAPGRGSAGPGCVAPLDASGSEGVPIGAVASGVGGGRAAAGLSATGPEAQHSRRQLSRPRRLAGKAGSAAVGHGSAGGSSGWLVAGSDPAALVSTAAAARVARAARRLAPVACAAGRGCPTEGTLRAPRSC